MIEQHNNNETNITTFKYILVQYFIWFIVFLVFVWS